MDTTTGFIFNDTDLFPQCHGSTLEVLQNGKLMVAWYGGTRESATDTAIYGSTLKTSGHEWNKPKLLAKISQEAHWNPVLFRDPHGHTRLYFKVGNTIPQWQTWETISSQKPNQFLEPTLLMQDDSGGRGPVRNKMVVLSDGSWIAPASHEKKVFSTMTLTPVDIWDSFVDISTDNGKTWNRTEYIERKEVRGGIIQPAIWESSPGNVHMFLRSTRGIICRSDSSDYGRTWSKCYDTLIPNNNSAVDIVKFESGLLVIVCNPVSGNWASRTPLSVSFSKDNGSTWSKCFNIEHSQGGGFAYPSAICSPLGIYVSYTWNRVGIRCVELSINEEKIRDGNIEEGVEITGGITVPESMIARHQVRKELMIKMRVGYL